MNLIFNEDEKLICLMALLQKIFHTVFDKGFSAVRCSRGPSLFHLLEDRREIKRASGGEERKRCVTPHVE